MYYPGQIVWCIEDRKPVNCDKAKGRTRHFIDGSYKIICPSSIKEAELLLERNVIVPAPVSPEWCWSCDRRKTDLPNDSCEVKQDHVLCAECNVGTIYGTFRNRGVCSDCLNQHETNKLRSIVDELLKEVSSRERRHDVHSNNISKLIEELVEFDDPYHIKRDGEFRDRIAKMNRLYHHDREVNKQNKKVK